MPETVFAKYAEGRADRFRITTRITEDGSGKRKVLKQSGENACADTHLARMASVYPVLQKEYADTLTVCPCAWDEGVLTFPYIDGISYQTVLNAAVESGDTLQMQEVLKQYVSIVEVSPSNHIPFTASDGFTAVFGEISNLDGVDALRLSNLDATGDNIIISTGSTDSGSGVSDLNLVDYEWIFEFPIPRDYVVYRNVCIMYGAYWKDKVRLGTLLDMCAITMSRAKLEELDRAFTRYFTGEGAGEKTRSKAMQEWHLDLTDRIEKHQRKTHALYIDLGDGIRENEKLTFSAGSPAFRMSADVTGAASVRFDPYEGAPALLHDLECITDRGEKLEFEPGSAIGSNGVFMCRRPAQLTVRIPPGTSRVDFSGIAEQLDEPSSAAAGNSEALSVLTELLAAKERDIAALRSELGSARQEASSARDEVASAQRDRSAAEYASSRAAEELNNIKNSKSWRYTEWLRRLRGLLRKK